MRSKKITVLASAEMKSIGGGRPTVASYQLWLMQGGKGSWVSYLRWWVNHH